jgi:hypothetical protein
MGILGIFFDKNIMFPSLLQSTFHRGGAEETGEKHFLSVWRRRQTRKLQRLWGNVLAAGLSWFCSMGIS